MGDLQSVITQSKDGRLIIKRNISGANQLLHANFNLVLQGRGARGWDERFAKCDYPIQGWTVNYKRVNFTGGPQICPEISSRSRYSQNAHLGP